MSITLEDCNQQWKNPAFQYRPLQIIHHYFPSDSDAMEQYIERGIQNGLGGFVINMNASQETLQKTPEDQHKNLYLGENTPETDYEWTRLTQFIDKCLEHQLKIWIYDENGYPSGSAGSWVIRENPDYQIQGVVCQTFSCKGGIGSIALEAGTLHAAAAYPQIDADTLSIQGKQTVTVCENQLQWNLPEGNWLICAFVTRPIHFYGETNKMPYVDLLREDVVQRFIHYTHERYAKHLGEKRMRQIEAIFTDEPTLPTHGCSSHFDEKYAVVPWTGSLLERFKSRFGYDITQHFDELFYQTDTSYKKARRDFWELVGDTYAKSFYKQIYEYCDEYGIAFTGHMYGEETLSMQIGLNADLFGLMKYMQMPGVDRLYGTNPQDVIPEKTASSAAHWMGHHRSMSESSFHFEHAFWNCPENATVENMINSCTYQFVLGITNIASYYGYQPENGSERAIFQRCMGRIAAFTTDSVHSAAFLVQIPMTAARENYMPRSYKYWKIGPSAIAPHECKAEKEIEGLYGDTLLTLMNAHYDFDVIDDDGIRELHCENGKITTGYETFEALLLFDTGYIEHPVKTEIQTLLEQDGKIILIVQNEISPEMQQLQKEYPTQITVCHLFTLLAVIKESIQPTLVIKEEVPEVWVRKGILENGVSSYLVHNRSEQAKEVTIQLSGKITVYNSITGTIQVLGTPEEFILQIPAKCGLILTAE